MTTIERVVVAGLTLSLLAPVAQAQAPAGEATPAVVKDFEAGQAAKSPDGGGTKAPAARKPRSETVKLTFIVSPRVSANVYHGKKLLGTTPFTVDWRRDSGPVDVVVRAHGYLPVNTRAYTFRDDEVNVKLTRPEDASSLLGYRAPVTREPEEGDDGEEEGETVAPDGAPTPAPATAGGAPAAPATAPAAPASP